MNPVARHRLFVIGVASIERDDTFIVECIHRLLKDQPPDQPYFLDADVSGLGRGVPSTPNSSEVPQFEV